jgi:osmotically-inducible protein OsmY
VTAQEIEKRLRAVLEHDTRVNLHRSPIDVRVRADTVTLAGEVASIEEKRIAMEHARAVAGALPVADRLRVRPTSTPGDGAIRDAVCRHLLQEPAFQRMRIECRREGDAEGIARRPDDAQGTIEASVHDGVVRLRGRVSSLSHRRLAAVLAWWAPGCRDVVNELAVDPPERDHDGEIREAIDLVLNKDPIVHSDQIEAQVRDARVRLRGVVATREEKRMAERDVWYIDGVRDVINELDVYQPPHGHEPMPADPPGVE